jgi:hypothetical protein
MAKRNKTTSEKKRLRLRQVALLNNVLQGSPITRMARKVGYSKKWPNQAGHQALQNLKLKTPELLDRLGLSDNVLMEKHLKPLLNARKVKFFQHKGKVTDKRIVPDNDTRIKGIDIAFKLRGAYPPTDPKLEEQKGVAVILVDIPRPGGRQLTGPAPAQLPSPETRS